MIRPIATVLLILPLTLGAFLGGYLQPLDDGLAELRFRYSTRAPTGSIVLVDIDAKSLSAVGQWPWPRTFHADILRKLTGMNAAEVAFDIDFSTRSTPGADLDLENALKEAQGSTILAAFNQNFDGTFDAGEVRANQPLERFVQHAWTGNVNVRADPDGSVRSFSFGEVLEGTLVPSLAAILGGYAGNLQGEFLIDFGIKADALDRISAIDLLTGTVDPTRVAGKKVIVGAAAVELRDFFQVPVFGVVSGTTVQALAAESILQGRMLERRTSLSVGILAVLGIVGLALQRVRWTRALPVIAIIGGGMEVAAFFAQQHWNLVPETAIGHATLLGLALAMLLRELGVRRILAAISSTEARNTGTILTRVVEDNLAGVVIADEDGIILAGSRAAAETFSRSGLRGRNCREALPAQLAEKLLEAISAHRAGAWIGHEPTELRCQHENGAVCTLEYFITPSRLSGGLSKLGRSLPDRVIATLTFRDVTARRAAEAQLVYLARFDTLTGLPNRNQFEERLADELARRSGKPSVVLFFDLDRFKNVNDALGHRVGDVLLKAVAERLNSLIGPADLAARFGGDEYAVLRAGDTEAASSFAADLIRSLGEPYEIDGHRLIIGASVGIALVDRDQRDPAEIMKNADTALYKAKADGGNAFRFYDASMDSGLQARQTLEVELWDAFEREQFEVHYQPQVDLATEEIIGVEALLRWRHPTRGFVSPAEFIPVAEAVGLIEPLGGWVMREACTAAAGWPRAIKVGVNVSPVQFARGDVQVEVRKALASCGLPAAQLDLEITESLFLNDGGQIRTTIAALRKAGVSFSIDDFGTGYSSLSYIRRFSAQKLKIDRSFVQGLPSDKDSTAIIRAVCAMADSLELTVIAEGIETREQASYLRRLGCKEGQGFLFSRPVPAAEIERMLRHESPPARLSA